MRIGTRVTLLTTMLVAPALAGLGYAALQARRADLEADITRQAREIADALRAGIEPLPAEKAVATLTDLAWRARERDDTFQLEILKAPDESETPPAGSAAADGSGDATSDPGDPNATAEADDADGFTVTIPGVDPGADNAAAPRPADAPPAPARHWQTSDPGWLVLVQAAEIEGAPVGRLFDHPGTPPVYAMAVPLFDEVGLSLPRQHPARKPVAVLGMRRSTRYIDVAVAATARRTIPLLLAVVLFLAVGVQLALRAGVTAPLRRLVDGINAVGRGDLSRVLLAPREDEIGTIASRFNAMTGSLREARQETAHGSEARLALETRLRQSEKLATIGQMAAEIAHEVGTPLNVIGGRARAMQRKAGEPAEVTKNAEIITGQVDRITKIINQVLAFSRKRGPTLTRVPLATVVRESLDFVGETLRRQHIDTDVTTLPGLPDVPGDPDQIQQVFLNLVMNAIHAMPQGGRLTVTLEQVTRRKEGLDMAPPADYALVRVADTGAGVAPADRESIFEPFFTTKDEGQGTGLGLAVSNGIVRDHDGWIEVESPPKGATTGTAFQVFLPLTASAAVAGIDTTGPSGPAPASAV